MSTDVSPYLLSEPPTSTGRALLARAFAHWCAVHHGHKAEEIAEALDAPETADRHVVQEVRFAARLLGELLAAGRMKSFARRFGGGSPQPIPASDWEIDDFSHRFARSAIDPDRPFTIGGEVTHWIFVDLADFNELVEDSCADVRPVQRAANILRQAMSEGTPAVAAKSSGDNLVRLPELMRRTGMSRSTIYRRMEQGRFPVQVEMDGNIAAWREGDVAGWLANPK